LQWTQGDDVMGHAYRLGLDLGTNSIGWCLYDLDDNGRPTAIRDLGARIFSSSEMAGRDPRTRTSLAAGRRIARSMRKRRDRYLRRRGKLLSALVEIGLLPTDVVARKALAALDPY